MVDQCSTCFFFRLAPATAGIDAGNGHCHLNAPMKTGPNGAEYPWVPVSAGDWCGEGATGGGVSFAAAINSLAGPVGPQGPAGAAGAAGTNGTNAPQWFYGVAAPGGGTGANGDFFLTSPVASSTGTASTLYQKIAGVWTAVAQWTSA